MGIRAVYVASAWVRETEIVFRTLAAAGAAALFFPAVLFAQVTAPSSSAAIVPPGPPVANGKGEIWSTEEQLQTLELDRPVAMTIVTWTPDYRIAVLRRMRSGDQARIASEMHEDKTQIYFILSGSGTQTLGGEPSTLIGESDGNHSGEGPLIGGESHRIKAGDVVVIPPLTWHQTIPDEGQAIHYQMVDVRSPTRMP